MLNSASDDVEPPSASVAPLLLLLMFAHWNASRAVLELGLVSVHLNYAFADSALVCDSHCD